MAAYTYSVRLPSGKLQRGAVQASGVTEALRRVKQLGLPLDVQPVRESKGGRFGTPKVNLKSRIIFTEQLAVMLNAGVTLIQALKGLKEEGTDKGLRLILADVMNDVEGGLPFSAALEKHPKSFSRIYCQMVKAAEKTGDMASVLIKLTEQQQKEYDLKGKVRGALMYPAIISILMINVIILVITFILPRITSLFTESATALPASTRFLIGLSDVFVHQWYLLIGGLVGGILAFRFWVRTPSGRFIWDRAKLRIPVLGSFMKKSYMARFTQSFASLAQAGIPVLEVFATLKGVVGNSLYESEIDKVARDVANGVKVSTAIRKSKVFPPMVGQLVAVGEQSGDLAGIFKVLGEFFEKEVDGMAKNLSTLLEPIIMIVMGAGIGFILISVLQPIYGLVNTV